MTADLAEWLLDHLADQERRQDPLGAWNFPVSRAERESKREIIAEHSEEEGYCRRCSWSRDERDDPEKGDGGWSVRYPCRTLRLLAEPHRIEGRPGYRPEWSPE